MFPKSWARRLTHDRVEQRIDRQAALDDGADALEARLSQLEQAQPEGRLHASAALL